MTTYRIEFRSSNIGANPARGSATGLGFAHNFLVLVEITSGKRRVVAELHGFPVDPKTGKPRFGLVSMTSGLPLGLAEHKWADGTNYYAESLRHPSFILFEGSKAEAEARFESARDTARWITAQKFTYNPVGRNSNAFANTIARAMGYDVTSQPIDRKTGRHIDAPSRGMDLREGRSDAPKPFTDRAMRVFGYGDEGAPRERPIPPEREAPPFDGPELLRRSGVPSEAAQTSYRLSFENARRFADEHRFDPRAEPVLSKEQNKIVWAWVGRVLAPAISHAQLPKGLADDVLDHAARLTPHAASLVLQQGLNRLAGPAEFGKTPPGFADGTPKRVTEDGWIGPETLTATEKHAAELGLDRVREAVALASFQHGLDALARGDIDEDEAPAVFRRSVGRLYRNPDGAAQAGFAAPHPAWPSLSRPRHAEVAALQESLNDANGVFGFADEPLKVDGDLGPKTGAALVAAARAAGPERLADHLGKRLGIGEPDLMDNPARGFDDALDGDDDDDERGGSLGAFA
jgi:hypothetical protein